MSMAADGAYAGRRLCDIAPGFPVIAKIIDARTRLSLQVHPNERTKLAAGGEAKTEMWFALSDGFVYAGLRPGTTPAAIKAAVADGTLEGLLVRHQVKAGDVLFIPGGLVHAVGDDTKLYEVQQSSDTTFRLGDWGRVGPDGRPRELHVAQALAALDCGLPVPRKVESVECPFFSFRRVALDGACRIGGGGYTVLYAFRGPFAVGGAEYPEGSSVLVLPGSSFEIAGPGSQVLVTEVARAF